MAREIRLKTTWRVLIAGTGVTAAIIWLLVSQFRFAHKDQPYIYGVSFSQSYAQELGLDWQAAYRSLLVELGFRHLRLMSYWDLHEANRDQIDFTNLDWQFEEARSVGAQISLAVGLRQPRWPECREPEWARQLAGDEWRHELYNYITEVVNRYKNHPSLSSWQLENEFGNQDFGVHCRDFDRERLQTEFDLVKRLDPNRPIIMNQSNQVGIPLSEPIPDAFGFSVYKRVYEASFLHRYITHPTPAWYHSFRAAIIETTSGKPVIIHELQAEPWTNGPVQTISFEEQKETMSLTQLQRNLEFARDTGIKTMYLWGAEWWYWRKTAHNDPSYWELIRAALGYTSGDD